MKVPALIALLLAACGDAVVQDPVVDVAATVETAPVRHGGDAADDPAIWVHPSDPSKSLILGDDKGGGLCVYGLDGAELQVLEERKHLNNVDVRYGFPLAGAFASGTAHARVDLVGVGNQTDRSLLFYKVDPVTLRLGRGGRHPPSGRGRPHRKPLPPPRVIPPLGSTPSRSWLLRSPENGELHRVAKHRAGAAEKWELRDGGSGKVAGIKVREFRVGSIV